MTEGQFVRTFRIVSCAPCRTYFRKRIDGLILTCFVATGRILYAKVAELVPKHREQMARRANEQKGKGNAGKAGGGGKGKGGAKEGKGAPAPVKKKKKGKR